MKELLLLCFYWLIVLTIALFMVFLAIVLFAIMMWEIKIIIELIKTLYYSFKNKIIEIHIKNVYK